MAPGFLGEQLEEGRAHVTRHASNRWDGREGDQDDFEPLIEADEEDYQPFEGAKKTAYFVQSRTRLRLKRILTGAALALVSVLVLVLFFVSIKRGDGQPIIPIIMKRNCSLRKIKPELDSPRVVQYSGRNQTNMASLQGYIRVYDPEFLHMNEGGYLPLEIKSMSFFDGNEQLSLEAECADVSLKVQWRARKEAKDEESVVHLSGLDWFHWAPSRYDTPTKHSYNYCSINEPVFGHTFPAHDTRYSCLKPQTFQCQHLDKEHQLHSVAELVIESLELELDGDADSIRRGHFSKPAYPNSCSE